MNWYMPGDVGFCTKMSGTEMGYPISNHETMRIVASCTTNSICLVEVGQATGAITHYEVVQVSDQLHNNALSAQQRCAGQLLLTMTLCRYLTSCTMDIICSAEVGWTTNAITHHEVMQIFDQLHDGHHLLSGSGLDKRLHQRGDRGCGQLPHGAVVAGFHALTLPLPRGRVPGMGGAPWEGGAGGGWDRLGGQSWLTAQATVCGDH